METKYCTYHEMFEPVTNFTKDKRIKDGYYTMCRKGRSEMRKIRKELKPKNYGSKERFCTNCKEIFITDLDEKGFSIETRCPECKSKQKSNKNNRSSIYHINL